MDGSVCIQGKNTRDYPAGGLSGIVGLVQQDPEAQLCTLTVCDEVAFGPENLCIPAEEIQERVYSSLKAVGALELIDRQVHTLSGGEKQRVAIASVLAMNPALLILDEPTAALDPLAEAEVYEHFHELTRGSTAIFISHRMSSSVFCDKILLLQDGRVQAFDSHRNLMRSHNLYRTLFETQAEHFRTPAAEAISDRVTGELA